MYSPMTLQPDFRKWEEADAHGAVLPGVTATKGDEHADGTKNQRSDHRTAGPAAPTPTSHRCIRTAEAAVY